MLSATCSGGSGKEKRGLAMKVGGGSIFWPNSSSSGEVFIRSTDLALNMFCQYIYLWMYVIPAADSYRWRPLDRPKPRVHEPSRR